MLLRSDRQRSSNCLWGVYGMSGSDGEKPGIAAALGLAMDQAEASARDGAEQLPLLPLSEPEEGAVATSRRLGPGRPKGSLNRKTGDMLRYLQRRYPSPLEVLAQTWSRPVQDLADELGIKPAAALDIQQRAAIAALPYFHEKRPVAVDVTSGGRPLLILGDLSAEDRAGLAQLLGDDAIEIEAEIISQENQRVSTDDAAEFDKGEFDDADKGK